jgi:hypothetical protein
MASLEPVKMYHGQPTAGTGWTTAYTVGAGKRAVLKHIRVTNTTASAATVTIITGTASTSGNFNYFANEVTVNGRDVLLFEINEVLNDGEKVFLKQGTASALTVQISGVEVTL